MVKSDSFARVPIHRLHIYAVVTMNQALLAALTLYFLDFDFTRNQAWHFQSLGATTARDDKLLPVHLEQVP